MKQHFFSLLEKYITSNISETINYEAMNNILISHHSTAIEGSSLTEDETRLLISEGLTPKGKPISDQNMVLDHHKALLWILAEAKKKRPITSSFIQELNGKVMHSTGGIINALAGSYDSSRGDFRKSNVFVGTRYFMSYQKVEKSVDELTSNLHIKNATVNELKDIYDLAFDAHFHLVSIHPFADGNGRTSRLLMNYILSYHQQPLAIIFNTDKADYYKALEDCCVNDEVNTQPIRDFLYSQQEKYLKNQMDLYNNRDKMEFIF